VGERDAAYRAVGERMAKSLPGAALQVVPGAGHAVHRERPQEACARIEAFLRGR
jgi:pimeloyl-ACP methyl ester carboxylesterase